jgi:murein DD-endopeptidase MepM/ murein hydrolase activator NlpD
VTKSIVIGLFTFRVILPVGLIFVPHHAEASILSAVASLFATKSAAASDITSDTNSQNMALLEAPVNENVHANQAVGGMSVEGSALVAESSTATADTITTQQSNEIITYTVKTDDTIGGIAQKFGISANTIIWANNLSRTSNLKVGQSLVILPISGVQHKVVAGDTIQSLAKKYKGDAAEIVSFNDIQNNSLKKGDLIVIPDGELTTTTSTGSSDIKSSNPIKSPSSLLKKIARVVAGVGLASADEISDGSGYYIRPIVGGVRTQGIHGNNGVDLGEACGSNLYASAAGTVMISKNDGGYNGGYGNYVVISHSNGSQTLYGHMQATSVNVGDSVTQGQMIGLLGNSGKVHGVTGCHVHFEIRNGIRNPF